MRVLRVVSLLSAVLILTAGSVFALGQPNVNLGFTSFLDGGPPAGPGHYISPYLQFYSADQINDVNGDKALDAGADVWILMNQYIYQSEETLLGGKLGINVMLPVVSIDADAPLTDNGDSFGDLLIGPYIQWDPIMGKNGPIMLNRIELQTIYPTGGYENDKALNAGSNHFSFNPYWAATLFLGPKVTASWRLHYLWNGKNDDFTPASVDLEPGSAVHANFAAAYEVLPKQLRVGINGYFLDQVTNTKVNGVSDTSLEEKVLALGPGLVWHFNQDMHLFLNAYYEIDSESRPEGDRYNMRFVYHF